MKFPIESILAITAISVLMLLVIVAFFLRARGLFRWTTFGFWAWLSFLLYFVLNPVGAMVGDNLQRYEYRILLSGGTGRALWILGVAIVGISVFFFVYLKTEQGVIRWHLKTDGPQLNILMVYVIMLVGLFALYSLVFYRSNIVQNEVAIVAGRFVGNTTAYANSGYIFWLVPASLLLLSSKRLWRWVGWGSVLIFVVFALPNGNARFAIVSILLAASIATALRTHSSRPPLTLVLGIVLLTSALQLRGHTAWDLANVGTELVESISSVPSANAEILGSNDASMLASWYVMSHVNDDIIGYDYGIPLLNYTFLGFIPSRIFPQKYLFVDLLRQSQPPIPPRYAQLLEGAKYTLLGSFYQNGGVLAVILMAGLTGYLFRKIDGMLRPDAPLLTKALGVSWLSLMWIVWGSSDYWAVVRMGSLMIPTLALWVLAPKLGHSRLKSSRKPIRISEGATGSEM